MKLLAKDPDADVFAEGVKLNPKFNLDRLMVLLDARAEVWDDFRKVARRARLESAESVFDLLKQQLESNGVSLRAFKKSGRSTGATKKAQRRRR
jgi:hypothetical protein